MGSFGVGCGWVFAVGDVGVACFGLGEEGEMECEGP